MVRPYAGVVGSDCATGWSQGKDCGERPGKEVDCDSGGRGDVRHPREMASRRERMGAIVGGADTGTMYWLSSLRSKLSGGGVLLSIAAWASRHAMGADGERERERE